VELGGQGGSNLALAIIREHLAARGLGLHNDLQNESSIVGNFPGVIMMQRFFDFDRLNMRPPVREPIPLLVGGMTDAAMRRIAPPRRATGSR
jgi:hypothetical protein